ncbi:hypothetical protein AUP68_09572 [Ilyonectria robusta]
MLSIRWVAELNGEKVTGGTHPGCSLWLGRESILWLMDKFGRVPEVPPGIWANTDMFGKARPVENPALKDGEMASFNGRLMPTGNVTDHHCAKRATNLYSKYLDEIRSPSLIIADDL